MKKFVKKANKDILQVVKIGGFKRFEWLITCDGD